MDRQRKGKSRKLHDDTQTRVMYWCVYAILLIWATCVFWMVV